MMVYKNIINFIKNRTIELIGLALIFTAILLGFSFFSYSPSDPTLIIGPEKINVDNLLGIYGGLVADFLLQSFGLSAFLILLTILLWGFSLLINKEIKDLQFKIFYLVLCLIFTCNFIYLTFNNSFWLIDNGNSGFVGQILHDSISHIFLDVNNEYIIFFFYCFKLNLLCLSF